MNRMLYMRTARKDVERKIFKIFCAIVGFFPKTCEVYEIVNCSRKKHVETRLCYCFWF